MTYFPFGAGPRSCIGNHFGLQELMIMTVLFHHHFQFRLQPGFAVEPDPLITLRPKHGMKMTVRLREPSPRQNSTDRAAGERTSH
jgi:cytochrome P450